MTIPQVRQLGLPLMNLVKFKGTPILQQLHLEESLLRNSSDNWCIINDGTNSPAIVMGLSGRMRCQGAARQLAVTVCLRWTGATLGELAAQMATTGIVGEPGDGAPRKPSELVEIRSVLRDQIPVIRRFTGGGTVIVDHGTIFVTFICNRDAVPTVQPYPRSIMHWSSLLYNEVFQGIGNFKLRENGKRLSLARNHKEFLCRMKDYLPRSAFINKTVEAVENHFLTKPVNMDIDAATSGTDYIHTTKLLSEQELEEACARGPSGEIPVSNLMI
ncbi:hypothetical protein RJ639_029419 [Escallonia herrerae]|uniref:BPL/LPL catalytic domain-containing protein n=1 Tax=Escallonia herrerae TaxID=1293975 RepID=A0AA88S5N2_9ASTE|nr:hypothetical protein RJ639_029419 [Escallonia herrerae]